MSWVLDYIGLPWEAGAQGPLSFDCMGLFGHVQREHFGRPVSIVVAPDYDDPGVLVDLFARHEERSRWVQVDRPEHGCAVIVRGPLHIGVWLEIDGGGVLHAVRGVGVIFTRGAAWQTSGFGARQFFQYKS